MSVQSSYPSPCRQKYIEREWDYGRNMVQQEASAEMSEIGNLQNLRATLEAIRQTTEDIHRDIVSAKKNHDAIAKEAAVTREVVKRV